MFSYRSIFRKALKITWRNKYLWFFGLFASLVSFGTEYQILSKAMGERQRPMIDSMSGTGIWSGHMFANLSLIWARDPWALVMLFTVLALCLIMVLFLAWLAIVSQAAIVDAAEKTINKRKEALTLGIAAGMAVGRNRFWRTLGLNIILKAVVALLVALVSLPLLYAGSNLSLGALYILLFITLVPTALVFSLLMNYSIAFVVIKDQRIDEALKNGWKLFRNNWLVSVEMAFMLFLVNFLFTLAIILAALVFFLIFMSVFSLALLFIGVLALIVFIILAGCALTTFQITAWTDLFIKLRQNKISSHLERLMKPASPIEK